MSLATRPPAHSTHPLARLLAGGAGAAAALQELQGSSSSSAASAKDPEQSFLVVEAEAAQRRCVDLAARDASFAIVGPPGAGKTQCLVNIIADCLGQGRSVLCIGRHPAAWKDALDLLTQAGLGEFCLPLKDDRVTRESIVAELTSALKQKPALPPAPATDYERLRTCAADLARFDEALQRVREPLQRSAASALAELNALRDAQTAPLGLAVRKEDDNAVVLGEITPTWLAEARQAVQCLAELWHLRTDRDLVWAGFKAERYTQQVREEVLALIDKVRPRLDRRLLGQDAPDRAPIINGEAAGQYQAARARLRHGLQQAFRADDGGGELDVLAAADCGGQMHQDVDPIERRAQVPGGPQVGAEDIHLAGPAEAVQARGRPDEGPDRMAAAEEFGDDVTPEETAGAGDEDEHGGLSGRPFTAWVHPTVSLCRRDWPKQLSCHLVKRLPP